jgi:hypothetical protein
MDLGKLWSAVGWGIAAALVYLWGPQLWASACAYAHTL